MPETWILKRRISARLIHSRYRYDEKSFEFSNKSTTHEINYTRADEKWRLSDICAHTLVMWRIETEIIWKRRNYREKRLEREGEEVHQHFGEDVFDSSSGTK